MKRLTAILLSISLLIFSSSLSLARTGHEKDFRVENPFDGGYIIAGACGSINAQEGLFNDASAMNFPAYTAARYSPQGNILWKVNYTDPRNTVDCEPSVEFDESNNIILTLTNKNLREVETIVKYNQYGEMLWVQRINPGNHHSAIEYNEDWSIFDDPTDPLRLPYQDGWPLVQQMSIFTIGQSITGGDFDPADDENELTLGMMTNMHAWNHDAVLLPGWPVDPSQNYRGNSIIVQDGIGKVSFASWGTPEMVHVYSHDGTRDPGWPQIPGGSVSESPVRADMDEDDYYEIVTGTGSPYYAYNWNPDASLVPNWPVNLSQNVTGQAVGDVNNDGQLELVCTSTTLWNKRVWVISAGGQILHEWQPLVYDGTASSNSPALADLDGDGDLEIILGGHGEIWCWHHDGTLFWGGILHGGGDISQIAVADLEGDGDLEVVVCITSRIYVFNHDGTLHAGRWPIIIPNGSWVWSSPEHSGPAVADIDDDGMQEIVVNGYCHGRWFIIAFNPDGTLVRGFPCLEPVSYVPACSPVILDIDGDGDIEICSYAENHPSPAFGYLRVAVYDLHTSYNPALCDWPMLQHDPQRTGCYGGLENLENNINSESPAKKYQIEPFKYALLSCYPNPFNASTVISFNLQDAGFVNLTVFDVQGREVRSLVDERQSSGYHEVVFDGSELSSGMYFAELTAVCYKKTLKMLLIK